jgi:hypothetical protein
MGSRAASRTPSAVLVAGSLPAVVNTPDRVLGVVHVADGGVAAVASATDHEESGLVQRIGGDGGRVVAQAGRRAAGAARGDTD